MAKPKGGARPGAGRPPRPVEEDARQAIHRALGNSDALDKIWKVIIDKAKAGSDKHSLILFNYYYGKPKDNEGQPTEMIINVHRRG